MSRNAKKILNITFIAIGIAFLVNAILGRYIVLPGYLDSLKNEVTSGDTLPSSVEGWKVARYLIWAYSFKLGIYFIAIGAFLKTNITKSKLALYIIGGFLYIAWAYIPIPGPSWLFGIGGAIMTILMILIILRLTKERDSGGANSASSVDLRIIGYFFFAMATYNLCPLLGVKTFGLEPENMIKYGLQDQAVSFAAHILIELVLGWFFIFLSLRKKGPEEFKAN